VTTTTLDPTTVATDPSGLLPITDGVALHSACTFVKTAETVTEAAENVLFIAQRMNDSGIWSASRYEALQAIANGSELGPNKAVGYMSADRLHYGY
jgi:hypothetical protein